MGPSFAQRLSDRFRVKRSGLLRQFLLDCPRRREELSILDLGGRITFWDQVGLEFLHRIKARITILNLSEFEMRKPTGVTDDLFIFDIGDACALDYEDDQFDVCHSNSVIEHVGLWAHTQRFAAEAQRVAVAHYVQTPNFWFPIDPHFWRMPLLHWMPRPTRAWLLGKFQLGWRARAANIGTAYTDAELSRMLTSGQMRYLFPESKLHRERALALTKSFIAIGPTRVLPG